MNIAELFVSLGIKGSEKTVSALGNVKKGLGEVSSMSLEAKAGLLAAMYGVEQLMSASGKAGTGLTNFSAFTGQSAVALQQWSYAARQAGESGEELTGNVKAVQSALTKTLMGEAAPKGMAMVARLTGGITKEQVKEMANNPFLMMKRLQEYALKESNVGLRNEVLKSFGMSEGTIAAMSRNAFRPEVFKQAPTYSQGEIKALDQANVGWSNLGNKIEMAMGHFNAKHGQQIVADLSKLVTQVLKFADALTVLADKLKIFQVIGEVFEGLTKSMRLLNGESLSAIEKSDKKKHHFGDGTWWMKAITGAEGAVLDIDSQRKSEDAEAIQARRSEHLIPRIGPPPAASNVNTTTVNQNIVHHGDAKDTKAVKDVHRAGVNHAYRQRQQGQGA